ncbi:MAG: glycerate kinase [Oligoflexia bacterium]|nr:glycerate kinase [Oligoflexia bacterium]
MLTGEGRFDAQSLAGKGPGKVVARAQRAGVPVVVLAGQVEAGLDLGPAARAVAVSDPGLPLEQCLRDTRRCVRVAAAAQVATFLG